MFSARTRELKDQEGRKAKARCGAEREKPKHSLSGPGMDLPVNQESLKTFNDLIKWMQKTPVSGTQK